VTWFLPDFWLKEAICPGLILKIGANDFIAFQVKRKKAKQKGTTACFQ